MNTFRQRPGADRCSRVSEPSRQCTHRAHAVIERLSCQRCCSPGESPVRTAEPFRSSASYLGQRCESEKRASTCVCRQDVKLTSSRAYHAARTIPVELLWGRHVYLHGFSRLLASFTERHVRPWRSPCLSEAERCVCRACRVSLAQDPAALSMRPPQVANRKCSQEQGAGHCACCRVLPTTYRQADVQVRCVAIVAAMQASAGKSAALQPRWRPSPSLAWCRCASGFDGTQLVA